MSKTDLICCLLGSQAVKLSMAEKILLEINLLNCIYYELCEIFKARHKEYQRLIKSNFDQEDGMYNVKFMQEMIKDILSTQEYSLAGIAAHTQIPEEVLYDVASGMNSNPTFEPSRRLFELHINVRHDLYQGIMQKIALKYLTPT